ncbi:MAG: CAAX amino protease [Candidatus Micrarchaeota archaeon]|nr:MAG: CAAX amino protease [Candidatus Micrarchaeota archaeon]
MTKLNSFRIAAYSLFFIIVIVLIVAYLAYSMNLLSESNFNAISNIDIELIFASLPFLIYAYNRVSFKRAYRELGLSIRYFNKRAILYTIALIASVFLLEILLAVFETVTGINLPTNVQQAFSSFPLYFYIFAAAVAPICEELLFRGYLVPRFGIVISALIFAYLHYTSYLSISEFITALIFALLAGYIFKKTKSLYPSIITHILVNTTAVISLLSPALLHIVVV